MNTTAAIVALLSLGGIVYLCANIIRSLNSPEYKQLKLEQQNYQITLVQWQENLKPLIDEAGWIPKGTLSSLVSEFPPPVAPNGIKVAQFGIPQEVEDAINADFECHNQQHQALQRDKLKDFFDTIEKNPLTEEQIDACVCMDENIQIVAAAGSGKTSTMVAKAGYALKEGIVEPHQILLLAFNRDAAQELKERVQSRLKGFPDIDKVVAKTFNAFALNVIGEATGRKPSIPKWVTESSEDVRMIASIINKLTEEDHVFAFDWFLYRSVYAKDMGPMGGKETPDTYENGKLGYRAASGDLVKSMEELAIANWLFFNHVEFEYERKYEHDTTDAQHAQYQPDFYYPDLDLYHEHFALNAAGQPPAHFEGYLNGVHWKRELHREHGTALFETYSHQIRNGDGIKSLTEKLIGAGLKLSPDGMRPTTVPPLIDAEGMAKLVRTFQQHVKSNGLSNDDLSLIARDRSSSGNEARVSLFLSLYKRISAEWDQRLKDEGAVDFEDMLIMAADLIEQKLYDSPYMLILADEFQDSSRARVRLLKALSKRNENVTLCVVGDDWQGINRFAGADISVMAEFDKSFENSTRLELSTTFRCPQELCDASSEFIQTNPVQIRKSVRTTNKRKGHVLIGYGFKEPENIILHFEKRLNRLAEKHRATRMDKKNISVLILGRYRKDYPIQMKEWQKRFGDVLDLDFRTVHRSKGLEADYVIMLNVIESAKGRGFPSQMEDDPLLQIPMPKPDPYPMAEERRLFYVALTRARQQVWIYTELDRPSRFLKELIDKGRLTITAVDGVPTEPCSKCHIGVMRTQSGPYGQFQGCSRFPQCNHKQNSSKVKNIKGEL